MAQDHAQTIKELEAKHGRVAHVDVGGKLYVFRTPTLDEWEDYAEALNKKRRSVAFRELAQITLVQPSLEDLQALINAFPAIATKIADAVSDLAGADIELTVKKG